MNNLTPMKNCPGVQGNLNWMSGYRFQVLDVPLHYIDECLLYSIWLLLHYRPRICTSEDLEITRFYFIPPLPTLA